VGERSNTSREASVVPSKAFSKALKFAFESASNGSWPAGAFEGPHRYTPAKSKTSATPAKTTALFLFLFIFCFRTDRQ
jgi:hypothetical protein